jgi:hypothetical protein
MQLLGFLALAAMTVVNLAVLAFVVAGIMRRTRIHH